MKKKVSDVISKFLSDNEMNHVFGIIGAGNVHIFDSVFQNPALSLVCVHHEQAACMAMQTYYRTSGRVTASILTTGAGSSNGITGVLSAWADSIPCLVISGNEHSKYIYKENNLRMYGVQGYDSSGMAEKITKYQSRVMDPKMVLFELEKALFISTHDRPGPCWIDIPMNVQAEQIEENEFIRFDALTYLKTAPSPAISRADLTLSVSEILSELAFTERPVLWLGHGIKLAHAENLIQDLISAIPAACIISWAGIDMVDSNHPNVFGRAGVYGQRYSNLILQNCDYLLTIGTRLSISQVGYDISELARAAKITVVDIDPPELKKYPNRFNRTICSDARDFIVEIISQVKEKNNALVFQSWIERCRKYKSDFPRVDSEHKDTNGFINSYAFMEKLNAHFKPNQIVVTDMGTALLSGHQVLEIKSGQRLMTSTGLGEMGYGLPAAIGASFASNSGEVLCLNCDGGMMMNLQELQTIVHYQLPIKIIIFNNDGYLMIKHTQKSIAQGRYAGTNKTSGVSCPDFGKIATAFGMPAFAIRIWDDFDKQIIDFFECKTAAICEIFMDPEQLFVPKLSLSVQKDGSLISPPLEDLYPFMNRKLLEENMVVGLHEKSVKIGAD